MHVSAYLCQCFCTCVFMHVFRSALLCVCVYLCPRSQRAGLVNKTLPAGRRTGAAAIFKAHLLIRNVSFRPDRNVSVARKQLRSGHACRMRKHLGRETDSQAGVIHARRVHSSELRRSLRGFLMSEFCCFRSAYI